MIASNLIKLIRTPEFESFEALSNWIISNFNLHKYEGLEIKVVKENEFYADTITDFTHSNSLIGIRLIFVLDSRLSVNIQMCLFKKEDNPYTPVVCKPNFEKKIQKFTRYN